VFVVDGAMVWPCLWYFPPQTRGIQCRDRSTQVESFNPLQS
jgi:hypothetical protein